MRIAYVGRFREGWATERDMATALRRLGHDVVELNEEDPATWSMLASRPARRPLDLVVWTTARLVPSEAAQTALSATRGDVPVVGYHLDRWWGLRRQSEMATSPFFSVDMLVTADGGHDAEWEAAGVRHHWLPPAVDRDEATIEGRWTRELAVDVAFVGSWRRYHPEWPHRRQLVERLRQWFGKRFGLWPADAGGIVRGQALADLYASALVVVGDSCLAGGGRYFSDRIPETLGRGGFLLHPDVEGLEEHYTPGRHLGTWPAYDWQRLHHLLQTTICDPRRSEVAAAGRAHVLDHHTYDVRAAQLLDLARADGLL